ncbi:phage distal tail protein domain-containing protein [Leuconostoc pseudomesenteroides]|uniref:phage distal tail protein domain-containing protein n=1 Tax=Leuconostoc pseudomesenteroides TaxID=33968 RepID=UPI001E38C091|nr:phage distal tail protein domain-containing protein [Leuconostoc pseudomesenteroides]
MSMFALTNARGETVDINNDKLLSYTPTGLGVQFTNTYSQYETYFKATKSTVTQGQFQINILFGDVESQAYQTFSDFAQFLAYQPLTLTYTTDSGTWYRDGRLNSLTKTEIGGSTVFATDRINESFTIEFINNWYNNKTAEYKSYDPDPNLGQYAKIYSYTYQPYYVYQESSRPSNEKVMSLNNKSQYFGLQSGSPSIITVKGPCSVNPTWTVVQKGNVVATDGFVLTLTDNQKLVVSSYPEDQYARLYNPDGSYVDVSQLQDYTKTNFVQIPEGESTVLFYLDADSDVNITFKEERLLV